MPLGAGRSGIAACLAVAVCLAWAKPSPAVDWSDASPFNTNAETDLDSDYYLHFAHDGAGNWVCVWCAAIPAAPDRDFDIMVSRSDDNGDTWTAPALLDPFATGPPEIEDDFHPNVYTDEAGHWIAVWYTHDNHGGTIGDDVDVLVSRSTDNGATWTPSAPLNSDAAIDSTSDYTPDLAYDGAGTWVAVWYKETPGTPDGDFDIYLSYSTDHGATWSPLTLLHTSMATDGEDYDGSPRIATDRNGHWLVAWTWYHVVAEVEEDDDILCSTSTDGLNWTTPAALNSDASDPTGLEDKTPRIAFDGVGRWVAVWYYGEWPEYDIRFSHSDDDGATWTPVEFLNTNALTDTGRDLYPVPATDGQGNWVVVWQSIEPLEPGVGTDYDIFCAYSTDNGTTWSDPGIVNSFAADPLDANYDRDPEILYAGDGKWLTAWGSQFNLGGTVGSDYDLMFATHCALCIGDLNGDDVRNVTDFTNFASAYGSQEGDPNYNRCADLAPAGEPDGVINVTDFTVFAGLFGEPCP